MLPKILAKNAFQLGARLRNPSLAKAYDELKVTEYLSREKLVEIQLEKASKLFQFASQYSPYYRELFHSISFNAKSLSCVEDIRTIPITEKDVLLENCENIHTQYHFAGVFDAETSGTTGKALKFQKNEEWDSINRAAMMRSYDWYGVNPWDYNGYLWGFNISGGQARKTRLLDFFQNRIRLFSYQDDEIFSFVKKLSAAHFLTGYSSMIYKIAKEINQSGNFSDREFENIKLIKGTSETILDVYRQEVKSAFGIKLTSEYGAAEAGLIAFECPMGKLHINIENVILEVSPRQEAVVTNLASLSFPVIRYNLGDIIELDPSDELCACGRAHPVIKSLSGRKGASVQGKSNQYPALTFYYVFKNLALDKQIFLNYRAFQDQVGVVDLKIEQSLSKTAEVLLYEQLHTYFGNDLQLNIEWNADMEKTRYTKVQYFNTTLE